MTSGLDLDGDEPTFDLYEEVDLTASRSHVAGNQARSAPHQECEGDRLTEGA